MSSKLYFTPGPTGLYPTVPQHIQQALADDVCAISHRSKKYEIIHESAVNNIKFLLGIPEGFHVFFTGSATEIWDRTIENLVDETTFHLVNGSFSKRYYETSQELGRKASAIELPMGEGFDLKNLDIPTGVEMICLTHNETSSGVSLVVEDIKYVRNSNPDALISVDSVSSVPFPMYDWSQIDTLLFSVQKGFGLPAGLGVWVVNEKCLEKSIKRQKEGKVIGSYHSIPSLLSKAKSNQTPETPNVLGIYLLSKVSDDMIKKGIDVIRKETSQKADLLYTFASKSQTFEPFVKNIEHRSQTVVVLNTKTAPADVNKYLSNYNMQVGSGYAKFKDTQLRIANFPGSTVEQVEELVSYLEKL
ncbi:MAG: aminotransferase class V-fold PLP-dependent enzyme [Cytophagales bacterium]